MYSISYVPVGGDFAGQDCAYWLSYGEPCQFADYASAAQFVRSQPDCWRSLDMKVVPLRRALELSAEMIEYYTGRREVQGFRRVVVNESKPDYQRIMSSLVKCVYPSPNRRLGRIERVSSVNSDGVPEPSPCFTEEESVL